MNKQNLLRTLRFALLLVPLLLIARLSGAEQLPEPAQPSATLSGTIRHKGNPVSGVNVAVRWVGGSDTRTTAVDGTYSVTGVATGGWVGIDVRPPANLGLTTPSWSTDNLGGDSVKDFDLVAGSRFTGEIRKPDGSLYTGTSPQFLPIDYIPASGEIYGTVLGQDGRFDLTLPPGYVALIETPEMQPAYMPHAIVDLTGGDVLDVVYTLQNRPTALPTLPPRADLIQVSGPDVDGYATVAGAPGAVAPTSAVVVVNLNAHTLKVAVSDESGAFSLNIFAPPGSSLLVRYDPRGDQVSAVWARALTSNQPGDGTLNSLPATIVEVGAAPARVGMTQGFNTAGAFFVEPAAPVLSRAEGAQTPDISATTADEAGRWAGWWITGTLQVPGQPLHGPVTETTWEGLSVQPGQMITLTTHLRATAPDLNCSEPLTYTPSIRPMLLAEYGADGWAEYWGTWFTSYMFTPTGLPIERESFGDRTVLADEAFTNLSCVSTRTLRAESTLTLTIPPDLVEGTVVPFAQLSPGGIPLSAYPLIPIWYEYIPGRMPPLQVGAPASPRIPWTLLGDHPINGHRGLLAREDVGHFAMPTRIVHPPGQVVVPRLDERSGEPIVYRLEPGSNWLSSADRRQPNPLHIPLALPSGQLIVEVLKPDGTVDQLGPAPILQSSMRTPTTPGGALLDEGTGHICDIYRLTTLDDVFDYTFDATGHYVVVVNGFVQDIYGNSYAIQGTYDLVVARVLDLDPAQLPTTPYKQGDAFAPGLHIFPPVPADVVVEVLHLPYSDPGQAITHTISGQANRFGYFQPPLGTEIRMETSGEFRVDISAQYEAPDGTLWMGAMTWGNVVEGSSPLIEAHGRRGMDMTANRQPWFEVDSLPTASKGVHVNYPYFSGDIHWGSEDKPPGDSIQAIVTIKDTTATDTIYNLIRQFATKPFAIIEGNLEEMIGMGEAPLFTPSTSLHDPGLFPEDVELWSYWYGSSQRPDVRVREVVNIANMATAYWRFNDTYGYQIGVPADGDQQFDYKWEFGGAVFRVISETNPINEYGIYSSLWVRLPLGCDAYGCARVTPPFQDATGASINGGPIMTMTVEGQVQEIDMFFLPKGVRPGDVLEVGDIVAFSGHVGPPLDSRVAVTVTAPSGAQRAGVWHANKIGWLYDPGFDFAAEEPGRWTVDVAVLHDRPYVGNGVTPLSHNTGTVLGTSGRYAFYVVEPGSPELNVSSPLPGFITWPNGEIEPISIQGRAPLGATAVRYTIHDKGVVMGQGSVTPTVGGAFTISYDAEKLHEDFPMLSLTAHEGRWEGLADEVAINLLAVGPGEPRAAAVTLIGEEVFIRGGESEIRDVYLPLILK